MQENVLFLIEMILFLRGIERVNHCRGALQKGREGGGGGAARERERVINAKNI